MNGLLKVELEDVVVNVVVNVVVDVVVDVIVDVIFAKHGWSRKKQKLV
jgi:hypothetical protein